MIKKKNLAVIGAAGRVMSTDVFYVPDEQRKPVVIYAHGFNGFKDWANFDLVAQQFAASGMVFVKFNFSHNGTTPERPEDFIDLEAFGQNNYTKEINDLEAIINWVQSSDEIPAKEIDKEELYLLGHSRGGAIVLLVASEDHRVKKVATWASVCECNTPWGQWSEEKMEQWKISGCAYYTNSRTKQEMPLYYQLFQDVEINKIRFNLQQAVSSLNIPMLICHGTQDDAVPIAKAHQLKEWQPHAALFEVDSDHVFGRKHPCETTSLPEPTQQVVNRTIQFYLK